MNIITGKTYTEFVIDEEQTKYPNGSFFYVVDTSDLVTFYEVAGFPITSQLIGNIQVNGTVMTKSTIGDALKSSMQNGTGGGGGSTDLSDYYKKEETSSKTEISSAISEINSAMTDNEFVVAASLTELKSEISGKADTSGISSTTQLSTAFGNVYEKNSTSSSTELSTAFKSVNDEINSANTQILALNTAIGG
jgi:hypothetical protein